MDVLRSCIWKILLAILLGGVSAFLLKEQVFNFLLAPCYSDFVTYRLISTDSLNLHLINTGLTEQMMIHLKVAF
ncbi:MAG: twin-arginine translocase subunit TatC [Paludibacteraceae bacterium]|nr:twin-arginine translocase subunit TatC [Paludibacteraceae bacterium]